MKPFGGVNFHFERKGLNSFAFGVNFHFERKGLNSFAFGKLSF